MPGKHHDPTDSTRRTVRVLSGIGWKQSAIAKCLGVCVATLRRHYSKEILEETVEKIHNVKNIVYQAAMEGNLSAAFFYLKTIGRLRESGPSITEMEDPDGIGNENEDGKVKIEFEIMKGKNYERP